MIPLYPWFVEDVGEGGGMGAAIQMSIICSDCKGGRTMLVTVGDRDSWFVPLALVSGPVWGDIVGKKNAKKKG